MAWLRPEATGVVERDGEAGAAGQGHQAGELGAAQQVEGQEDVAEAGIGHDLGLAQLLAGDADGAELDLAAGELRDLVGLDVRAELQPVRVGISLRAAEIGLDPVEVDEHGRGVEVVDDPGHGGAPLRRSCSHRHPGAASRTAACAAARAMDTQSCDGVLRDLKGKPVRAFGPKSGAAPATVGGEPRSDVSHWGPAPGRRIEAVSREPGDLPSRGPPH